MCGALAKAGTSRKDVLSIRFFTTDTDGFLADYDVYADWISAAGTRPPQSLLGIQGLVLPEPMVEIEAIAAKQIDLEALSNRQLGG